MQVESIFALSTGEHSLNAELQSVIATSNTSSNSTCFDSLNVKTILDSFSLVDFSDGDKGKKNECQRWGDCDLDQTIL